jgi:sulfhydrogenase subunit gamma (sulfur reductase)
MDEFCENQYIPSIASILDTRLETPSIKRFLVQLPDKIKKLPILPGQFFQISIMGFGEVPISVSDYDSDAGTLLFCIADTGTITHKIHGLEKDQVLGLRGPFGNGFPMTLLKNQNVILIAGGIGLVPLRSVVSYSFKNPDGFKKLEILYGAKSSSDIIYKNEIKQWRLKPNTILKATIDNPEKGWTGNTGFVSKFIDETFSDRSEILYHLDPERKNTKILVVGPPVMYQSIIKELEKINFSDKDVYFSLENRMKCGIGKCGHCNCGSKYVCLDGPIFSWYELKNLPKEY